MSDQSAKPSWTEVVAAEWERRHGDGALESKFEEDNFRYPLIARAFGTDEVVGMIESIMTGQLTMSHSVKKLEEMFAEYMNVPYAVMVNSGSSANLLAMAVATNPGRTKCVPKGSECLVPAVCWSTSLWPVIQMGLTPVLVDVDPKTLQIDVADMQRKITKNTSSMILVHVLGNMGNMGDIMSVVNAQGLVLIEDTCESLGADYDGTKLGAFGDFGTFSFYFSHHITTGEGGMVVCKTLEDYDLLRCLRAHGWSRELSNKAELEARYPNMDKRFLFVNLGYNLRPMEISGAIGIKQMERLPHMNSVRNENHDRIEAALKASPLFNGQLDFVEVHDKAVPAWFGFSCLINSRYAHQHTEFLEYLTERGIENRPIISGNFARQPGLELLDLEVKGEDFPGAESIGLRGFFFGVHTTPLTENQVQYLVDTILGFKWNPRNIVLVTGGSGLVGKAMQAQIANDSSIIDKWVFVSSSDCDLTDLQSTRDCFRQHRPTHVIHLAVLLMDGAAMRTHKVELWETNMAMNQNILKICREFNVQKLVSCLSSFAYPAVLCEIVNYDSTKTNALPKGSTPEGHLHQGPPNAAVETYAYAKRMMEVLSRCYREQYGCNYVTVLPTNIFGPYGKLRANGPVVEGLMARTIESIKTGEPLQLYGTGKPKRQFLYSKDLAKLLQWAVFNYNEAETINFVGEEVSISEVVEHVTAELNFKGETKSDVSRPDGPLTVTIDGSKLEKLYPAFQRTPFKQAIKETVAWHQLNQTTKAKN